MIMTWATPGTPSNLGRITQSASERSSMAEVVLLVIEMSTISPIVDEIGPSTGGRIPAGRRTCPSFSVTSLRAREMSVPGVDSTETIGNPATEIERDADKAGSAVHRGFNG